MNIIVWNFPSSLKELDELVWYEIFEEPATYQVFAETFCATVKNLSTKVN